MDLWLFQPLTLLVIFLPTIFFVALIVFDRLARRKR
jgi:hypothetical protein